MKTIAMSLTLNPQTREQYLEAHRHVWPELIEAARRAGIRNHSVFLRGNDLFLYAEADNPEAALSEFLQTDVKRRWDAAMQPYIEPQSKAARWQEVFHFD